MQRAMPPNYKSRINTTAYFCSIHLDLAARSRVAHSRPNLPSAHVPQDIQTQPSLLQLRQQLRYSTRGTGVQGAVQVRRAVQM